MLTAMVFKSYKNLSFASLKLTLLVVLLLVLGACSSQAIQTPKHTQRSIDRASLAISNAEKQLETSTSQRGLSYTQRANLFLDKAHRAKSRSELTRANQYARLAESEARVAIEAIATNPYATD